jgi:hypothetical protein
MPGWGRGAAGRGMMAGDSPTTEDYRELLALLDVDYRLSGRADAKREALEKISNLSDSEVVALLSLIARGSSQEVAARARVGSRGDRASTGEGFS